MQDEAKTTTPEEAAPAQPAEKPPVDKSQLSDFERVYEHMRGVPLKYIDIFIGVCIAALVFVVALGIYRAKMG